MFCISEPVLAVLRINMKREYGVIKNQFL